MSMITQKVNFAAAGAGGDNGWGLDITSPSGILRTGDADSSRLVFGHNPCHVMSYDHDGNQNWQKEITSNSGQTLILQNLAFSGGIDLMVWQGSATTLTKLNNDGSKSIDFKGANSYPPSATHESLTSDGSNIYFVENGGNAIVISKWTSSYTQSWTEISSNGDGYNGTFSYANSGGLGYISYLGRTDSKARVARINTANGSVFQWEKSYGPSGYRDSLVYDVARASNGDAIVVGKYQDSGYNNHYFVMRLTVGYGFVTWSKEWGNYGGYSAYPKVTVDQGTDDIYVSMSVSNFDYNDVMKFSSDGTHQWTNRVTGYKGGEQRNFIKVPYNNAGYLFHGFRGTTGNDYAVCRIPTENGVAAGTYGNFTFSFPSLTINDANIVASAHNDTFGGNSYSVYNHSTATSSNSSDGTKSLETF